MYAPDDTTEYERRFCIYAFEYAKRALQGFPLSRESQQRLDQLCWQWGLQATHIAEIEEKIFLSRDFLWQLSGDVGRLKAVLANMALACLYPVEPYSGQPPAPSGTPSPLPVEPAPALPAPVSPAIPSPGRSPFPWGSVLWVAVGVVGILVVAGGAFVAIVRQPQDAPSNPPATAASPLPSPLPTTPTGDGNGTSPVSPLPEPSPSEAEPAPTTAPVINQTPADAVRDRRLALSLNADFFNQLYETVVGKGVWETLAPPEQDRSARKLLDTLETELGLSRQSFSKLGQYDDTAIRQLSQRQKAISPSPTVQKEMDTALDERLFQSFPDWRGRKLPGTGLDQVWLGMWDDTLTKQEQQR